MKLEIVCEIIYISQGCTDRNLEKKHFNISASLSDLSCYSYKREAKLLPCWVDVALSCYYPELRACLLISGVLDLGTFGAVLKIGSRDEAANEEIRPGGKYGEG